MFDQQLGHNLIEYLVVLLLFVLYEHFPSMASRAIASWRHYCVPTGFPITWVLVKPPYPVTLQATVKILFRKEPFSASPLFAKTWRVLFENSMCYCSKIAQNILMMPRCSTVKLTNEFCRSTAMPNDLVIWFSCGQNSLNLCTSQDWISKIVADIWKLIGSTDALQIFLLLTHLKIVEHSSGKGKKTIFKRFFKASFKLIFFFLPQSFQSLATYL